jgi:hypothetical protein
MVVSEGEGVATPKLANSTSAGDQDGSDGDQFLLEDVNRVLSNITDEEQSKQLKIVRVIWRGENGTDDPMLWTNKHLRPISLEESIPPDPQDANEDADQAEAGDGDE